MGQGPALAYLAEGKLYFSNGGAGDGASPRLLDSPFVQGVLDRAARDRQRNEWKSGATGWAFTARGMMARNMAVQETRQVKFTGIAPGHGPAELIYSLELDQMGGLFVFDTRENHERRLFHRAQFIARDVARHPADGTLAMSLRQPDGTANIATLAAQGKGLREVTEGDSIDQCPSWTPDGKKLVFQSAGIGRNEQGIWRGLGPYAIQQLDFDRGDLSTLLEDDRYDFLSPRMDSRGALYCIRRPYEPIPKLSPLKALSDLVLFPFRLVRAIVHFLDFFSLMFSRKPLLTAGGAPKEGPDARYMMLWGKLIDAEKIRNAKGAQGDASLVPPSWELIRRLPGTADEVLAKGVLAFDLCPDGILYTNGSAIHHRAASGDVTKIFSGRMIETVVSLSERRGSTSPATNP